MKFFILLFSSCFSLVVAHAQGLSYIDRQGESNPEYWVEATRVFANSSIPAMPVEDLQGRKTDLRSFTAQNRLYKNAPVLFVTSYSFCNGCIKSIKDLYKAGLAKKYNMVVIYEAMAGDKAGNSRNISLADFIQKHEFNSGYPGLLFVKSSAKNSKDYLMIEGTPLYYICDKNLKPVYSGTGYESGHLQNILELVDKGSISREKISYSKQGSVVANNDENAYRSLEIKEANNRLQLNMYLENQLLQSNSYLLDKNIYLKDGMSIINEITYGSDNTPKVKPLHKREFKAGRPLGTYTTYYSNGAKRLAWPLNGQFEYYDESGNLAFAGPVKEGVADGIFKKYTGKQLVLELTYVKGLKQGGYKSYKDGKLASTGSYINDKLYGLEKRYNPDGSVHIETWQSDQYDDINNYADDLVRVKKDDKYGFIDKKGNEVIPLQYEDAEDFKNGKARVMKNGGWRYIDIKGKQLD